VWSQPDVVVQIDAVKQFLDNLIADTESEKSRILAASPELSKFFDQHDAVESPSDCIVITCNGLGSHTAC
jgi:hypothetical protein